MRIKYRLYIYICHMPCRIILSLSRAWLDVPFLKQRHDNLASFGAMWASNFHGTRPWGTKIA